VQFPTTKLVWDTEPMINVQPIPCIVAKRATNNVVLSGVLNCRLVGVSLKVVSQLTLLTLTLVNNADVFENLLAR